MVLRPALQELQSHDAEPFLGSDAHVRARVNEARQAEEEDPLADFKMFVANGVALQVGIKAAHQGVEILATTVHRVVRMAVVLQGFDEEAEAALRAHVVASTVENEEDDDEGVGAELGRDR